MSIIIPANSAVGGGFDVDNSLRFNSGSSDYLNRTPGGAGNRQTWTLNIWVKRATLGVAQAIFTAGSNENNVDNIQFDASDRLNFWSYDNNTDYSILTTRVFRDTSSWYNLQFVLDTTNGTANDRVQLYVNGVRETVLTTNTMPSQNYSGLVNTTIAHYVGRYGWNVNQYFNGYMAEITFIDGQALAPTSFGEFDEDSGIWKPINVSGLTFGTNGFYLDFENSSALGNDAAGSNNFTVNNLAAIDQTTDTCTNNFPTVNILDNFYEASTFSEGNLKIVTESGDYSYNTSTIGLSSGKWYCEVFVESSPTGNASIIGIAGRMSEASLGFLGGYLDTYGFYGANGNMYNIGGNGVTSYGSGYGVNSVIGIYMDLDNNKLYFAINGSIQNSGTGYTILAPNLTKAGFYFPAAADNYNGSSGTFRLNFGNPIYALSSANTDVNGYGSFEYDPSSGTFDGASKDFLAICTKNLSEVLS